MAIRFNFSLYKIMFDLLEGTEKSNAKIKIIQSSVLFDCRLTALKKKWKDGSSFIRVIIESLLIPIMMVECPGHKVDKGPQKK